MVMLRLMVDRGFGSYAGPRSTNVGQAKTKANQTVQLNAKPPNHPFPTPRSGFVQQVAGANRRWRCQFRCRGLRRESAVAQLSTFGCKVLPEFVSHFMTFLSVIAGTNHPTSFLPRPPLPRASNDTPGRPPSASGALGSIMCATRSQSIGPDLRHTCPRCSRTTRCCGHGIGPSVWLDFCNEIVMGCRPCRRAWRKGVSPGYCRILS